MKKRLPFIDSDLLHRYIYKENFMRDLRRKIHQNWLKNKQSKYRNRKQSFLAPLDLLFL